MTPELLSSLDRVKHAKAANRSLSDAEKRGIFLDHFSIEQHRIATPRILEAIKKMDWQLVKWRELRPTVRLTYLPNSQPSRFRNFADQDERIKLGPQALGAA